MNCLTFARRDRFHFREGVLLLLLINDLDPVALVDVHPGLGWRAGDWDSFGTGRGCLGWAVRRDDVRERVRGDGFGAAGQADEGLRGGRKSWDEGVDGHTWMGVLCWARGARWKCLRSGRLLLRRLWCFWSLLQEPGRGLAGLLYSFLLRCGGFPTPAAYTVRGWHVARIFS